MLKYDTKKIFFVIAVILVVTVSGFLWWLHVDAICALLAGMSIITFVFYGYDKLQAIRNRSRVPELILHILALLGGTPGAFIGQLAFKHKTKKPRFLIIFIAIVLLQVGVGYCYWFYWR
jgi:uncharacterized membrane protein YsdA (DUF1294 family)